jgi:glycogen debranching enzyme
MPGATQHPQFFIPAATSLQERRPRTLKHGDAFGVFDPNGDILSGQGSPEGLFYLDTRHLSHLYLTVGAARPMLLSSTLRDDNATLTCDLTNGDLFDADGNLVLAHDVIHLRRSRLLWDATCFERLAVRNFDEGQRRIRLSLDFAADFADLFEVRGTKRKARGHDHRPRIESGRVVLSYTGLDQRRRETALRFDPAPTALGPDRAVFDLVLDPQQTRLVFVEISCRGSSPDEAPPRAFFTALRDARRALRRSSSRAVGLSSSNDVFNEALRRSVSDLYMLITDKPQGPYPYAGIPWFSAVFGRDAMITAMETLWLDPAIARGVLGFLAANQATEVDAQAESEPGKILHELRHGEMAELGEVPFRRYYGSIDSTPLFVMLAGAYFARTGDVATIRRLWPHVERALAWIDDYGDPDGDGFVEYAGDPGGLVNQGWKDSQDSVFHADGTLARGPIALVEVQAFVYGAQQAAATLACGLGMEARANELTDRAEALRRRFDAAFFDEALGTYVLALDGDKQPCRVRASNAGYALLTGIAMPERAQAVVKTLMDSASFSGWGVRTLAMTEARYNPMSYHNGSVWPHDNALLAAGFARYGFRRAAARIFDGLFGASIYIDQRRLPELFCGFGRQRSTGPTFYPVACSPQAWAAVAPLSLIRSCLGLRLDPAARQVRFDRPVLPGFLDKIVLRHLSIGDAMADIAVQRAGAGVVVNVLGRQGDLEVVTRT